ncbi:HTH binding domain protein [Mycobacterium phage Batiatus]|uniref:Helix-turn-helix DNA-binding domain protein n=2 Tax=Cheoctovirus TaxID=1623281 RepID=A0A2P1N1D0_9CAUD|nr:HTH binding domain protein [Mycobacterium phage Batiatus]AVP41703.1 helix-turn-helix DNA-binding domain protein [Mycobacterium phage Batiatus]
MSELNRKSLLTMQQAATYLGVTDRTVRNYVARGLIPARRLGPKLLRIRIEDLQEFAGGTYQPGHLPNSRQEAVPVTGRTRVGGRVMSFYFYSDPIQVIKKGHGGVTVGRGENNGSELAYLNVGDGYRHEGDVLLDADELTDVIDQLIIIRNAMRLT